MSKPKPHVSEVKKKEVAYLVKSMKEYPVVGLVNMESLPTLQLQRMRDQLKGTALIRMSKGRLIRIAMDQVKDSVTGIEQLKEYIRGMPALIFTKQNPFKLYKTLAKSKSSAPAKAGQVVPKDIIVPAGPTAFAPGPIIGELGEMGIKAGIEDGKVAVKEDTKILSEGDVVTQKQAELMSRLGIEPMEVGLNLTAILEEGTIFTRNILEVDEDEYVNNIKALATESMNLAMHIGYTTKDTINLLIVKAHRAAKGLADSQDIMTSDNAKEIIAKAENQATALKSKVE